MKIQEKRSLSFKGSEIDRWTRLVKRRKKIKHMYSGMKKVMDA